MSLCSSCDTADTRSKWKHMHAFTRARCVNILTETSAVLMSNACMAYYEIHATHWDQGRRRSRVHECASRSPSPCWSATWQVAIGHSQWVSVKSDWRTGIFGGSCFPPFLQKRGLRDQEVYMRIITRYRQCNPPISRSYNSFKDKFKRQMYPTPTL